MCLCHLKELQKYAQISHLSFLQRPSTTFLTTFNLQKKTKSNKLNLLKNLRTFCHVKTKKPYVLSLTSQRYFFGKMCQILTLFL